jgi:nitroreductase
MSCFTPSANNSQPWKFIVVKDQKIKELLSRPSSQKFIVNANAIVMVLGDPSVSCCPAATWTTRDPMIATDHLVLAATALGYGTCWIANYESRPEEWVEEVKKALKIPEHMHIIVLVAIGVPDENPAQRPRKKLQEISYLEQFGNPMEFY